MTAPLARFFFTTLFLLLASLAMAAPAEHCPPLTDRPIGISAIEPQEPPIAINTPDGPVTLERHLTRCATNAGWIQPLIPVPGIIPVTELELIAALEDPSITVVDMRSQLEYLDNTIPGAINIPYTEITLRLDELGCIKGQEHWDCRGATAMLGFCNGPVCPQSPQAMRAMVRDGFPPEKIQYYRGGMLDWIILGFTTVPGSF